MLGNLLLQRIWKRKFKIGEMASSSKKIRVRWSNQAKSDLRYIYERIKHKTQSIQNAKTVRTDIIEASKRINFVEQYQVDEFLGEPFRRIVVRHFKVVYEIQSPLKFEFFKYSIVISIHNV